MNTSNSVTLLKTHNTLTYIIQFKSSIYPHTTELVSLACVYKWFVKENRSKREVLG